MGFLEDIIRCRLSHEFYKENKELFKTDPVEYHRQCRIYMMGKYRERLEKEKRKYEKPDEQK